MRAYAENEPPTLLQGTKLSEPYGTKLGVSGWVDYRYVLVTGVDQMYDALVNVVTTPQGDLFMVFQLYLSP